MILFRYILIKLFILNFRIHIIVRM